MTSVEADFVAHCRHGDAECLHGAQWIGEVQRELVRRALSELQHDVVTCKQRGHVTR